MNSTIIRFAAGRVAGRSVGGDPASGSGAGPGRPATAAGLPLPLDRGDRGALPARDPEPAVTARSRLRGSAAPLAAIPLPGPEFAVDFQHYPTAAEVVTFLQQLETTYPDLVQVSQAGASWQGRPILAIRLGNEATGDPDARPAFYLDGQHHACEAISAQVVAYFVWVLLNQYGSDPLITHLLDTRTVYAIPMVNPDGNEIFLDSWQSMRKTANPTASDDDGDGAFDEDGPTQPASARSTSIHYSFHRRLDCAASRRSVRRGLVEPSGRQRDLPVGSSTAPGSRSRSSTPTATQRVNEDPPGGVDANRNYDSHWDTGDTDPRSATYRGPAPFSEPEARRCATSWRRTPPSPWPPATIPAPTSCSTRGAGPPTRPCRTPSGSSDVAQGQRADRSQRLSSDRPTRGRRAASIQAAAAPWTGCTSRASWPGRPRSTPPARLHSPSASARPTPTVRASASASASTRRRQMVATLDRWLRWNLYLLAATPSVDLHAAVVDTESLSLTMGNDGLVAAR